MKMLKLSALLVSALAIGLIVSNVSFARITDAAGERDAWCVGVSGAEICVDSSGNLIPTTDNDADLGTSSLQFKDLYLDGTLYTDAISNEGAYSGTTGTFSSAISATTSTLAGAVYMGTHATKSTVTAVGAAAFHTSVTAPLITGTKITAAGALKLYAHTQAGLLAMTGHEIYSMFVCSDCTVTYVCISTGTGTGAFVGLLDPTTACD